MSGDLVRYERKSSIELAPEAWGLAQKISGTAFVPKDLRGKPEAVLAAILTGNELGIGAMQALAKIHVIEGRPSIAAELMRALVMREGHEIWVEELSNTRCTIGVQRSGSDRQQKFTWTIDDARTAGLAGKDNWRKYPRAMLMARATGEACRIVFPDLLAGMSYTSEELTDGEGVDIEDLQAAAATTSNGQATETPKRTARARKAATAPAGPPPPPTRREEPALPGEESSAPPADDDIEEAEVVEDEAPAPHSGEYEGPDTHSEARAFPAVSAIAMRFQKLGVTDRARRLSLITGIVGREVDSSKDLTEDEVRQVLDTINAEGYQPDPPAAAQPARRRRAAPEGRRGPPDMWTGDQWREYLAFRSVKAVDILREASKLAREREQRPPGTLDEIGGSGLAELLADFADELAQSRKPS